MIRCACLPQAGTPSAIAAGELACWQTGFFRRGPKLVNKWGFPFNPDRIRDAAMDYRRFCCA